MTITRPELALADRRAKREIVAVENDLAKWEDMLGLPESGCELVVEDARRYISMSLSSSSWSPECISPLVTTFSFSLFSLHDPPLPFLYHAAGFKPGVLAVFRGQNTCFEMLTKEIVIGRGSVGGEKVNIDLMREVPNSKVSRKQVGLSHSLCVCIHVITVMRERADPPPTHAHTKLSHQQCRVGTLCVSSVVGRCQSG